MPRKPEMLTFPLIITHSYVKAIFSGLLLGLAFPPSSLGFLALAGLAPLLTALDSRRGIGDALTHTYITFFVYHGLTHWWFVSPVMHGDEFLSLMGALFWLVNPIFFCLPLLAYAWTAQQVGRAAALAALPFFWVAYEWLRSTGELWTPELALGYTQVSYTLFVQCADIFGVWGLSFLVLAFNVFLVSLYRFHRESKRLRVHAPAAWLLHPYVARRLTGCTVILVGMAVYGVAQIETYRDLAATAGDSLTVAVVQADIDPWQKWEMQPSEHLRRHLNLLDSSRLSSQPDVAIWSENALPFYLLEDAFMMQRNRLSQWVDSTGIAVLTGCPVRHRESDTLASAPDTSSAAHYNALVLLKPGTPISQSDIYRKVILTPFSEHIPYSETLAFLARWIAWDVGISGWTPAKRLVLPTLLRSGGSVPLGSIICVETAYPEHAAQLARSGAAVLCMVTNDGWYAGTPGPAQHFAVDLLRAIETRRYIARCSNTGPSGIISAVGRPIVVTPEDTPCVASGTVPLLQGRTLFVRYSKAIPLLCVSISILILLYASYRRYWRQPV